MNILRQSGGQFPFSVRNRLAALSLRTRYPTVIEAVRIRKKQERLKAIVFFLAGFAGGSVAGYSLFVFLR